MIGRKIKTNALKTWTAKILQNPSKIRERGISNSERLKTYYLLAKDIVFGHYLHT